MDVKICYKCKEVVTFCECDNPIISKDEYIEYLENEIRFFSKLIINLQVNKYEYK